MANDKVTSFQVQGVNYSIDPDLTFDQTPTIGSSNPVTSNGIALAIQGAEIGTDISVGRTPGTPIGYCSIAYGSDNTAVSNYTITFGNDNVVSSEKSIICGSNIDWFGGNHNAIFGKNISGSGYGSIVTGNTLTLGYTLKDTTIKSVVQDQMYLPDIYIGYFDSSSKTLYYDPEHTTVHPITFKNGSIYGTTYIVDLSTDGGRDPGTIFEYTKKSNGTTTAFIVLNQYVCLTDKCQNTAYYYDGTCYYNINEDKCYRHYSGGTYTDEITNAATFYIYFDINSGYFVTYIKGLGQVLPWIEHPNWIKVNAYRATMANNYNPNDSYDPTYRMRDSGYGQNFYKNRFGRKAYVVSDTTDMDHYGRAYTSPDYSDESDITDQLYDGEIVVDMSQQPMDSESSDAGGWYVYRFTKDRVLTYVNPWQGNYHGWSGLGENYIDNCAVFGSNNYVSSDGYASIICGQTNQLRGFAEYSFVCGNGNSCSVGSTDGGYMFISGYNNYITASSDSSTCLSVMGATNYLTVYGDCRFIYTFGQMNEVYGENYDSPSFILGERNDLISGDGSHIYGQYNKIRYLRSSFVMGAFNYAGYSFCTRSGNNPEYYTYEALYKMANGIYKGYGVTYDSSTGVYTFDTHTIYRILEVPDTLDNSISDAKDYKFVSYAQSTDGHTLTTINDPYEEHSVYILGYDNNYAKYDGMMSDSTHHNIGNIILGRGNRLYAYANDTTILIGKQLLYYANNLASPSTEGGSDYDHTKTQGTVIVGQYNAWNTMPDGSYDVNACAINSQFIVGIGTGDNNRKNGFVVYKDGVASLPNAPDSVTAASALCQFNPNRMVVTLGMLRDYAPQTPGAVGKPAVTTVTLTTAGWNNTTDQTISLPDILASSVVMIQASGNPYAFYLHNIYLSAQTAGSLTFTCTTEPQVDIDVKVVYWT